MTAEQIDLPFKPKAQEPEPAETQPDPDPKKVAIEEALTVFQNAMGDAREWQGSRDFINATQAFADVLLENLTTDQYATITQAIEDSKYKQNEDELLRLVRAILDNW